MPGHTSRLGLHGYARILHSIMTRRGTKTEIFERGLCGRTAVIRIVASFHALGLVHVGAWRARYDAAYQPVYEFGPGADVPPPLVRHTGRPVKAPGRAVKAERIAPELLCFHTIFEALQAPVSLGELMIETGIAWLTAKKIVSELRALELVYVAEWRRGTHGGRPEAVYAWGVKRPDVACPPADRVGRNRRYRQNRALRHLPRCFIPMPVSQSQPRA